MIPEYLPPSSVGWGNGAVRPPRVLLVGAEGLRKHVQQFPDNSVRELIEDAITAWERATKTGLLNQGDLDQVVAAATSSYGLAWGTGGGLLGNLAGNHPAAKDAVRIVM